MITALLLVTVVPAVIVVFLLSQQKRDSYPPGPTAWPIIGNHYYYTRLVRKLGADHLAYNEISKKYGSDVIGLRLGTQDLVVVSGNKYILAVLNSQDYDGRPWTKFMKLRNVGKRTGITGNDGPEWKVVRSWLVRTFRAVGLGGQVMSNLIQEELVVLLESMKKGGVLQMKPLLAPVVINVLWTLTCGKRFVTGSRLQYFSDLVERRSRAFDVAGGILSIYPWIRYIAPEASGFNLLVTINNEVRSFLAEIVQEHKNKYVAGGEIDLIDLFLREMSSEDKEENAIFTEEQLVMILVDLFLAGISTTVATLDFLFLHMALHQDVQRRLQEEIDSVVSSDRLPNLDDRPKLSYFEAVVAEVERQWLIVPTGAPRRTVQDTTLGDYKIPKDTTVILNLYSAHMDPNVFPDPHLFKPERHLKDGVYEPNENLLTFGRGHRRCPGEVLARSALFLLFAGVMQRFNILPVPGRGPTEVEYVSGLTVYPKQYEVLIVSR